MPNYSFIKLLLFSLLLCVSCSKESQNFKIQKRESQVRMDVYKSVIKNIDYSCRPFMYLDEGNVVIKGLTKDKMFFEISSATNELKLNKYPKLKGIDKNTFSFHEQGIRLVAENQIVSLNEKFEFIDSTRLQLNVDKELYGPLYSPPITKFNGEYFIQLGDLSDTLNYSGGDILLKVKNEGCEQIINYPNVFKREYIHYTDAELIFTEEKVFYTFPTLNKLYSYNFADGLYSEVDIPGGNYLKFDEDKITDMLYINDYSLETCYNVNLYYVDGFIVLLRRDKPKSHKLVVFDKNLEFKKEISLDHFVHFYDIYSDNDELHFFVPGKTKLVSYDFSNN